MRALWLSEASIQPRYDPSKSAGGAEVSRAVCEAVWSAGTVEDLLTAAEGPNVTRNDRAVKLADFGLSTFAAPRAPARGDPPPTRPPRLAGGASRLGGSTPPPAACRAAAPP